MRTATISTVVVADPDERSRRIVVAALRYGGYGVAIAHGDKHIASLLGRHPVVAVVIDPTRADGAEETDGSDAARSVNDLRARTEVAIIVVSDRSEEHDKVALLDAGADDYLCKPVGVEELLARLRGVLRRTRPHATDEEPFATADFTIHLDDRRVIRADGHEVHLTPIEWRLVDVLVRRPGHLVSQADLLERVWGPAAITKTAYLRVHMASIRHKLEPNPGCPRYFVTAAGLGLRFEPAGGDHAHEANGDELRLRCAGDAT
jgi:two-component system KDP operon response regulator KdpE